jgi:hypothetical protein
MGCVLLAACAAGRGVPGTDAVEATLAAPQERVKQAMVKILDADGYSVSEESDAGTALGTGFRRETRSHVDWLLIARFGTGRSRVQAHIATDTEATTKLTIEVVHEGKDGLFEFWRVSQPPVAQSAANYLRLVKNELGLL